MADEAEAPEPDIRRFLCGRCHLVVDVDFTLLTKEEKADFERYGGKAEHPEGQCPPEIAAALLEENQHTYRVEITLYRDDDPDPVGGVRATVQGMTFPEVSGEVTDKLGPLWDQIVQLGSMVDG